MQKYGLMANNEADADFVCDVCGKNHGFNWSDYHGEGMCNNCGTPYDLKSTPHTINIKETWLPALKEYWEETGAYMGLGQIMIERDYPECVKGQKKFYAWLDKHPGIVPAE